MTPRRILVTGGSGFIGQPAVKALAARGFEVHAVSRRPLDPSDGIVWHTADLLDPDVAVALVRAVRPSHLLHLAWCVTPGRFWTDPQNLDWVAASLLLVRHFREAGGQRAVLVGSCAEYDWSSETLDEANSPLRPSTLYGAAKLSLFTALSAYARQTGLSMAWGRLFFLFGPGEAPGRLVSDLCASLVRGQPIALSHGLQERDFLHVDDVAAALAATLERDVEGAVNIARGETTSVRAIAEILGQLSGRTALLQFGARPPADGPEKMAACVTRLRDQVGFVPAIGLEDGLVQTFRWWQRRLA